MKKITLPKDTTYERAEALINEKKPSAQTLIDARDGLQSFGPERDKQRIASLFVKARAQLHKAFKEDAVLPKSVKEAVEEYLTAVQAFTTNDKEAKKSIADLL